MKPQSLLILAVAILMGGAAVYSLLPLINRGPATAPVEEMTTVVSAVTDIPRGGVIQAEMLKSDSVPKRLANTKAITKPEDAIGHVAIIPMLAEEPILTSKITEKGTGGGLASLIPLGMRAVTIQTPTVASGVAGFILPGNKVDVLLTISEGGARLADFAGGTVTLLQNLEVLAVDQRVDKDNSAKTDAVKEMRSVTLLVTPDQAKKLDLGQNLGNLHLTLRNPEDSTQLSASEVTTASELKLVKEKKETPPEPPKPAVAVAPPPPPTPARKPEPIPNNIRTIRGVQEGVVQVYPFNPPDSR